MANRFSITAVFNSIDNITAPIAKMTARLGASTAIASKHMKALDKVTSSTTSALANATKMAATGFAAAGAGLAVLSKPGMDFEQSLANLGAVSLQSTKELAPLKDLALELGAATQFSATQVADAMGEMAKAGFTNEEILKGVGGMIYAASAAGEDLAATTESISSVMKGMGLATSQSARVADVLALASVRTSSSIGSIAESMSKVSSTARQLGVPLEDTVAMVSLLQDVGIDASEAGSATATMLTMMANPSKKAAEQMKRLGVSFKDAKGDMLSPVKVLEQLVKAGEKAGGNMDQVAFFAELMGLRGQKAAVNLKDLFAAGKFSTLVDELGKAQGTAKKMADLRMDTLTGDIDKLTEGIKGIALELYDVGGGALRDVVQGMGAWVDANKGLIVSGIVDTVKAIGAALPTIATWLERIGRVVAVFTGIALAIKGISAIASAASAVMAVVAAVGLAPVLIVAGIVAAVAALAAFWPEISAFCGEVWEGAKELGESIWNAIEPTVDAVVGFFERAGAMIVGVGRMAAEFWRITWSDIAPFFSGLWSSISSGVSSFFDGVKNVAVRAAEVTRGVWEPLGDFLKGVWTTLTAPFDGFAQGAKDAVAGIKLAFGDLTTFFDKLWSDIGATFTAFVKPLTDGVAEFADMALGFGRDDSDENGGERAGRVAPYAPPQIVNTAAALNEQALSRLSVERTEALVTIRDQTGRATVTKPPRRGSMGLRLEPSGSLS